MITFKSAPSISNVSTEPMILAGSILMGLAIVVPCLIWFIRNVYRIMLKKDYFWLNQVLKFSWIGGALIFVIGLVLLIVKLTS